MMVMDLLAVDEAGPLWILLENFLDWLGFWGRIAVAASVALGILVALALMTRRKS
jgi:hypothetical protein